MTSARLKILTAMATALALVGVALPAEWSPRTQDAMAESPLAAAGFSVHTSYLPSKNGFEFKNRFSTASDNRIVRLFGGRCGGMAFGSLDLYYDGGTPGSKEAQSSYIVRRNIDSLVGNGARFLLWTAWSDLTRGMTAGVGEITRREELPLLATRLADGPVPLGLIATQRIADLELNHQVVAYAMESKGGVARIWIYDPNHPLADDVVLEVPLRDPEAPIVAKRGTASFTTWRGLFVERYHTSSR